MEYPPEAPPVAPQQTGVSVLKIPPPGDKLGLCNLCLAGRFTWCAIISTPTKLYRRNT
ncbi:hypothetical protein SBV1_3460006 [Verrucomicrobia bacterium]|nr:hypothetical protein SBV1_3460006 [Verrucomicrobiota bacterium]